MNTAKKLLASAGLLLLCAVAQGQPNAEPVRLNIPAQRMQDALNALAEQAGLQVVFTVPSVEGKTSPTIQGSYSPEAALKVLLAGTSLSYEFIGEKIIAIRAVNAATAIGTTNQTIAWMRLSEDSTLNPETPDSGTDKESPGEANKQDNENSASSSDQLQEIVVTAQKKEERLRDVPVPVTVITAASLINDNQLRVRDYYTRIPGLSLTPRVQSQQILSIRGLSTGPGNPTVGIVVDGLPFGSSTNVGGGSTVPDFDPGDLARIEVLRGPQGTLFGASSIGGLLNFITLDPSTNALTGRMQVGAVSVSHGKDMGYNVRGSVNVPVSETFAFRASGFTRRDPGYIRNPVLDLDDLNRVDAVGGRLSALWQPSDVFSLKLSALFQQSKGEGSSDVLNLPGLGDLEQTYVRGTGIHDRRVQAYSATLHFDLGRADLTALSGFNINEFTDSNDYTFAYGPAVQGSVGVPGALLAYENSTAKFTQELRLTVPFADKFEWLLGAFYTHEDSSPYTTRILAADIATGDIAAEFGRFIFPTKYEESAVFTDVTYRITDRFDVQLGGRGSQIRQVAREAVTSGTYTSVFLGLPSPVVVPEIRNEYNAVTYLATPRFKVSQDLMVYARLASGYRAGGINGLGQPGYDPDKTYNYEIGAKGNFLDGALSLDASLYYIDWRNLHVAFTDLLRGRSGITNAGRAKSQGVELSLEAKPRTGLSLAGWVVWGDADLTENFPSTSNLRGFENSPLPFSSRWSANLSIDQEFPLSGLMTGFVGATAAHIDDRVGVFRGPPMSSPAASLPRQIYPAYTKVDLRAGVRYEDWTVGLFVNNLTDERAALSGGLQFSPPFAFTYIDPRALGLNVVKEF